MNKIIYFTSIAFLLIMTSCPESTMDVDVVLINHSEEEVFFCLSIWEQQEPCPSITLPITKIGKIVGIGQKGKFGIEGFIPVCDSIKIFVLSSDTVNTYAWEEIRNANNILKRYDLTFDTLEKMKWTITYP